MEGKNSDTDFVQVKAQLGDLLMTLDGLTSPAKEKTDLEKVLHRLDEIEKKIEHQPKLDLTEDFEEQAFIIVVMVSILLFSAMYVAYVLLDSMLTRRGHRRARVTGVASVATKRFTTATSLPKHPNPCGGSGEDGRCSRHNKSD